MIINAPVYNSLNTLRIFLVALVLCWSCAQRETPGVPLEEIAGNPEVLTFMKTFEGRGVLSDSSRALSPEESLKAFRSAEDLRLELILSEPDITQPVYLDFDHRGRLWVVQYNQYPYPKDLKVTSMDQHIRATFDKVPPPPGNGPTGADRITFFEDTDGDGSFDRATEAIGGLNIATSVVLGRNNIWVLNPPYLLAYPDADDDGIPDGPPVVHLEGFGLEDTHAVANSLRWGPDGWLYGAQGSTCTANISSSVTKNIAFDGQVIWRYHPETKVFEVFAEGGGNTFDVEIDEKGRLYSGDNGTSRGQYYKQGAYYPRNFGKHGALSNPHALGFLSNMDLQGENVRFTHAFVKYEENNLSGDYRGKMIAINPLRGYLQLSRFEENGSTFRVVDERRILETADHWFRPVDIITGPDGAVYIADWYDSRLSHVDPRDTWSKNNGRIYRISGGSGNSKIGEKNIGKLNNQDLVGLLSHPDRWQRQQALRIMGDRKDRSIIPLLIPLLYAGPAQQALEALWALNLIGGFNDSIALKGLHHPDPFVRMWTVRLAGDDGNVSQHLATELAGLSQTEPHAEVRSQLAATAKRLPGRDALPIIQGLLKYHDDSLDPDIPLMIWWALESKTITDTEQVLALFRDRAVWRMKAVQSVILGKLAQRYAMAGDSTGFAACATLLKFAPSEKEAQILMDGLQEGLRGAPMSHLPPSLLKSIEPYQESLKQNSLVLSLRQGNKHAISQALERISNTSVSLAERLAYVRVFGEVTVPESVPVLLKLIESNQSSPTIRQAGLQSLQRYDDPSIGRRMVKAYPDKLRADPGVRLAALTLFASRPVWAKELLNAIDRKKQPGEDFIAHTIRKEDVPDALARQLHMLDDPFVSAVATRLWPTADFSSAADKTARIREVSAVLKTGNGRPDPGKKLFMNNCGACHRLFGQGGTMGPDLSGYDRKNLQDLLVNIIDPGAYVREGYATYRISTRDGRTLSGTITDRNTLTLSVTLLSGEKIVLPSSEVVAVQTQPSIMPDKLLDRLTDEEIRDLFAYLTK